MTIDLRGIGDAVRTAATGRGQTVAAFARQALVAATGPNALAMEQLDVPASPSRSVAKLHLRMDEREAQVLIFKARALGLSYGEYVGHLVTGTPLPAPVAQRDADRRALRQSCDQLAALAGDINALIRLLRLAQGAEAARQFGDRMRGLEADVRRHIDLASRLVADPEDIR
ncbi:MAG: hypothetical protein KIT35_20860 [Piscinibacter sp.]|uniref:hypothetical protein n=1 Tax=Piscinibacter sp. TaxID=1903157 RepID=UPI00258263F7|nr:hypothetical protein [Piscinibacter sp.]MCW5666289.1 hypothetical protein [Piscinibacter sp.]